MSIIYVDIETLPASDEDILNGIKSNLKAPSNYKDPEKIASYIEDNLDKKVRDTALSGLFGQVLCIGYAVDDGDVDFFYADGEVHGESQILSAFRRVCCDGSVSQFDFCQNVLVGHNILDFDAPFLSQRMMINGLPPLFRHHTKPWDMSIDDTMTMFACGKREHYSLENLCKAFSVESPKGEITGANVYDYWLEGEHEKIAEYCKRDVEATRSVYKAMTQQLTDVKAVA